MSIVAHDNHQDDDFDLLIKATQARFAQMVERHEGKLFKVSVDSGDLFNAYLSGFVGQEVQIHTCHHCYRFIEAHGSLAVIDEKGALISALWDASSVPEMYKDSVQAMASLVEQGHVSCVYHSSDKVWGVPETGKWTHLSVTPPAALIHNRRAKSAYEEQALSKENYRTLSHGLSEFNRDVVSQAVGLIQAEALYRSEKLEGPAKFLLALHDAIDDKKGLRRNNLIWRAIAGAPVGFCTPRSSMVGTLLEDIASGLPMSTVQRRFAEKMNPLQYQRPQAAPTTGNILAAEQLVKKLGIERSLERRFARLDEIKTIWKPRPRTSVPASKDGVFGHLVPKGSAPKAHALVAPLKNITFEKFRRTVLPDAIKIEVMTSSVMTIRGLLTAVHEDAPPIFQWDTMQQRNPFSGYVYKGGSNPINWKLPLDQWVEVTGVTLNPAHWYDETAHSHQHKHAVFVLHGAQDKKMSGLALFPENLSSDLHSIRATIEAYSKSGVVQGEDEASANGYMVSQNMESPSNRIRVTTEHGMAEYRIDRWD